MRAMPLQTSSKQKDITNHTSNEYPPKTSKNCLESTNFPKLQVDIFQPKIQNQKVQKVEPTKFETRIFWGKNRSCQISFTIFVHLIQKKIKIWTSKTPGFFCFGFMLERLSQCNTYQKTQKHIDICFHYEPHQLPFLIWFPFFLWDLILPPFVVDLHPALRSSKSISSRLRLIHSICTSSRILLLWLVPSIGVSSSVLKVTPSPPSVPSWSAAIRRFFSAANDCTTRVLGKGCYQTKKARSSWMMICILFLLVKSWTQKSNYVFLASKTSCFLHAINFKWTSWHFHGGQQVPTSCIHGWDGLSERRTEMRRFRNKSVNQCWNGGLGWFILFNDKHTSPSDISA